MAKWRTWAKKAVAGGGQGCPCLFEEAGVLSLWARRRRRRSSSGWTGRAASVIGSVGPHVA
eukprot:3051983-Pyramimonas_sp.AAC.1